MNRLLGYIVTFLMLLFMFDGVLRIAGCGPKPSPVEFSDTRGWANKKSQVVHYSTSEFKVDYDLNSKGLRGPETEYAKPADKKRILFVGDSFTLGFSVAEKDSFVRVVEADLRANGLNVEALNSGTQAYSTDQELCYLIDEGLKYQPDYVVIAPYLNDVIWNTRGAYSDREKPRFVVNADGSLKRQPERIADPGEKAWWIRKTAIGNLVDTIQRSKLMPLASVGSARIMLEDAPLLASPPADVEESWAVTGKLLADFAARVKAAGAQPIALLVPNKWEIHADEPALAGLERSQMNPKAPTDRFQQLCTAAGFAVVDPRATLAAEAAKGTRLYFSKDFHWNADGNHLAAGALLERLTQPDMLGPGNGQKLHEELSHEKTAGFPTWAIVAAILALALGTGYWRSYPREYPVMAYGKVFGLVGFVVAVFLGVGKLTTSLPPSISTWVFPAIIVGLILFILVKIGKRFGVITELYGTFLRRGHWYMLPMLVVMLSIGMLLVVAASSPFVAPFIYTLF